MKEPELKVGQPANLSLFTTDDVYEFSEDQILSSSKNSIAIGKPMKGKVVGTIANNQLVLNK